MSDKTLSEQIEELSDGEDIINVVIGRMSYGDDYGSEDIPQYKEQPKNVLISWEKAKPLLNYSYHEGYGSPDCNSIYAWTKSWVILVEQYDGSTSVIRIPRNPVDCEPIMPGG